ncbi:MAG TPA: M50 family metallopeptidase [Thermoanaerobaculia bacterium]|nr:M50 family metallopeptidase [Thermoanaerobaculia bacterium]
MPRITRETQRMLAIAFVVALVVYLVPFTRFVLSALVTLFHEFGHAVMGWILGYPSLPAFDLVYGGGFTHQGTFKLPIAILVAGIFGYIAWLNRDNRRGLIVIGIVAAVWLLFVTREWRRELAIASAGHLAEFVLAGVMLYKSITGEGWRNPDVERPLGAFIAFFVQIHSTHFAWKLIHDTGFLEWYREGKGGAIMNDLEVVALDLQIWLGWQPQIEGVAKGLLFFSLVPLVIAVYRASRVEIEN